MRYTIIYKTKCGLSCEKTLYPTNGLLPNRIVRNGRVYEYKEVFMFGRHAHYIFKEK